MPKFWYLATPYSKLDHERAYRMAVAALTDLLAAGVPTFSPIVHTYPPERHGNLPSTYDFWYPLDRPLMDAACGLIVLEVPETRDSDGVKSEAEIFLRARKPIYWWHREAGHRLDYARLKEEAISL